MKGSTGVNTGTIIDTNTKEKKEKQLKKIKYKNKDAKLCKKCEYCEKGFCKKWSMWCRNAFLMFCKK